MVDPVSWDACWFIARGFSCCLSMLREGCLVCFGGQDARPKQCMSSYRGFLRGEGGLDERTCIFLDFFGRLCSRMEVWGEAPHQIWEGFFYTHCCVSNVCRVSYLEGCSVLPGTPSLVQPSKSRADAGLHASPACKLLQLFMMATLA